MYSDDSLKLGVVAVALALASSAGIASAQPAGPFDPSQLPTNVSAAEQAFAEGRVLLEQGKFAEACAQFETSLRLDADAAGTLLNLGLCHQRLGQTATALAWFRKAQFRAAETSMTDYEQAAKTNTLTLAAIVPTLRVEVTPQTPAGSPVFLDDQRVADVDLGRLELDPGTHVVELRIAGAPVERHELTVHDGDKQTLTLGPVAAAVVEPVRPGKVVVEVDRGRSQRLLAYALGGAGVALWGGSLAVSLAAKSNADASEHPDDWQHEKLVARFGGTSMFLVGTAAIATGVYLYVRAPGVERVERMAIAPAVSGDALGVSVHGAF